MPHVHVPIFLHNNTIPPRPRPRRDNTEPRSEEIAFDYCRSLVGTVDALYLPNTPLTLYPSMNGHDARIATPMDTVELEHTTTESFEVGEMDSG